MDGKKLNKPITNVYNKINKSLINNSNKYSENHNKINCPYQQ